MQKVYVDAVTECVKYSKEYFFIQFIIDFFIYVLSSLEIHILLTNSVINFLLLISNAGIRFVILLSQRDREYADHKKHFMGASVTME